MQMKITQHKRNVTVCLVVLGGISLLSACSGAPVDTQDGRVYHCVATNHPIRPSKLPPKNIPLELFEYGNLIDRDRPTISGSGYCATQRLPSTAHLRYRVDGKVIEKHFDLSSLTPQRVYKNTVEFYVDGETVEVRLLTPVPGDFSRKEIITRQ